MYCCTFGCIENHWTIEKRRKVSWQKLKNSKHPCFAYTSLVVWPIILHWVYFCSLPFFKKTFDIWPCWRKIQTEKWTQEDLAAIDVGSLWHPILLAWTYFCSQKRPSQGETRLARRWHTVTEEQIKNSIPNNSVKKTLDGFDLTSNLSWGVMKASENVFSEKFDVGHFKVLSWLVSENWCEFIELEEVLGIIREGTSNQNNSGTDR